MGKPSKQLLAFMEKFKVDADEIWEVRSGGAWAIKHAALERVAAENGITFDPAQLIGQADLQTGTLAMMVVGHMGDKTDWSTGEASPKNNKNNFPVAMAEKRARDRVALKLLNAVSIGLYSEEESEDFKRPNPHVTRPTDIVPEVEYDENGHPVDNIPVGDERIERLPKAKAKTIYAELQAELYKITDAQVLSQWASAKRNIVETLPTDWQDVLRGQYADHLHSLRNGKAA